LTPHAILVTKGGQVRVTGFDYARTRLPTFACKGWSVAYVLLFMGPLMLLPCAALNEWGSSVWIMEELAVAPLRPCFLAGFPSRRSACRV